MLLNNSFFDVEFAADLFSVTKQTIITWIDSGRIKVVSRDEYGRPLFDWKAFSSFSQVCGTSAETLS